MQPMEDISGIKSCVVFQIHFPFTFFFSVAMTSHEGSNTISVLIIVPYAQPTKLPP